MPSGTAVTSTPSTRTPEPWPDQPAERADPQRAAGRAVGAGVGEEPADDRDAEADHEGARGRGDAAEHGEEHERSAGGQVPLDVGGGALRGRRAAARSWPSHHVSRPAAVRRSHAAVARSAGAAQPSRTVDAVMRDPDAFDAFYKDDPRTDCCCRPTRSPATSQRPAPPCATRSSLAWHHWRKVVAARRPGDRGPPERLAARAAPAHRPALAPREGPRPRGQGRPSTSSASSRCAQRQALLLTQLATVSIAADGPRDRAAARRGGARAAERRRRVRPAPRGADRRASAPRSSRSSAAIDDTRFPRPTIIRRAGAARRRTHTTVGAIAAVAVVPGQRHPGHRRGRRTPEPRPRRPPAPPRPTTDGAAARSRCSRRPSLVTAAAARHGLRRPHLDRGTHRRQHQSSQRRCCPASASRTPTRPAPRRWCGPSPAPAPRRARPRRSRWPRPRRRRSAARRTYRHPGRLVRRLRRRPGPADRDPHASRRSATRRSSSCCAPGTRPVTTHRRRASPAPGCSPRPPSTSVGRDDAPGRRRLRRDAGRGRRRLCATSRTPAAARPTGRSWRSPRRSRSARRRRC